jgi:preprotein translocase subunit SecD
MKKHVQRFFLIIVLTIVASIIALPKQLPINFALFNQQFSYTLGSPVIDFNLFGKNYFKEFELKKGLDIQGGIQIVLEADMSQIAPEDQAEAIASAQEIILRRVDMYGLAEPTVKTSVVNDSYRIVVELPGIDNPEDALMLVGQTAQLEFQLVSEVEITDENRDELITTIPEQLLQRDLIITGLTGAELKRASVISDPQTGEPLVNLDLMKTVESLIC